MLKELDRFDAPILVAGCQRSGTTIVSRILTSCEETADYYYGCDDELDAAEILSGVVKHTPQGRYCFQTTYVNECYEEYIEHSNYYMVWMIRNPASVVYSMTKNWTTFALDELFEACGVPVLDAEGKQRFNEKGAKSFSRMEKASFAYKGKSAQLLELADFLPAERLLVVDYDDLVMNREIVLPRIFDFVGLKYQGTFGKFVKKGSVSKFADVVDHDLDYIQSVCSSVYEKSLILAVGDGDQAEKA